MRVIANGEQRGIARNATPCRRNATHRTSGLLAGAKCGTAHPYPTPWGGRTYPSELNTFVAQ